MQLSDSIKFVIQQKLSEHFPNVHSFQFYPVGGGSINDCYRISFGDKNVFCKINSSSRFPRLFQKEKAGLELIAKGGIIKTPKVIDCFEQNDAQVLLLEWIESGERTSAFWKTFGEQLAAVHQASADYFGLKEDNYMGSVTQSNYQRESWTEFLVKERIRPIVKLCFDGKLLSKAHLLQFEKLEQKLSSLFEEQKPSLLHGDLWSGNFMCSQAGEAVLIDPAVYYGHRSMDLAMTTLFGGFQQSFYEAYNHHFPLPKNYEEQWSVCNLYPLLIHLHQFGSSYLPQIERTLQQFA